MNYIIEKSDVYIEYIFFQKSSKISCNSMLKYFKIKRHSYFALFFKRLYRELFCGYTNLYKEYKKYYKNEFDSYNKYLTEKYNLLENELLEFSNKKKICYKRFSFADDNVVNTLCDEKFYTKFERYMRIVYEN